jgi:hypothetical protein
MPVFHSSCHCGNLQAELETRLRADELVLRSCQCSFCKRHRARTVADKDGRARLRVSDPALLSRYQWNLRSAASQLIQPALEVSYDAETLEQRRKRRQENWTPAVWERP